MWRRVFITGAVMLPPELTMDAVTMAGLGALLGRAVGRLWSLFGRVQDATGAIKTEQSPRLVGVC